MNELVVAVKAWPVLAQGVVSSAIFWLILLVGQKLTSAAAAMHSKRSRLLRRSYVISKLYKLQAFTERDGGRAAFYLSGVLFRASRPALKALMWLVAGLSLNAMVAHLGLVAYAACLYYLLKAYGVVAPFPMDADLNEEIKVLAEEFAVHEQERNSIKPKPLRDSA